MDIYLRGGFSMRFFLFASVASLFLSGCVVKEDDYHHHHYHHDHVRIEGERPVVEGKVYVD